MRQLGVTRQAFKFLVNGKNGRQVIFSAAFIAEGMPWQLLLGARKHNRFGRLRVQYGFQIDPLDLTKDFIIWLSDELGLEYDPDDPFTRYKFVTNHLFPETPCEAQKRPVHPHEIPVDRSQMEEGEKIYFLHWLINGPGRKVTEENLLKTKELISTEWADICRRSNISSCWSAFEHERKDVSSPPAQ